MAEYIEREVLKQQLQLESYCNYIHTLEDVLNIIDFVSATDVVPVVHSYWESYDCSQYMGTNEYGEPKWRDGKFYICHNCRCRRKTVIKSLYCPNCGAKMDGGADHEDD